MKKDISREKIIKLRMSGKTIDYIAKKTGLTRERIRQISNKTKIIQTKDWGFKK